MPFLQTARAAWMLACALALFPAPAHLHATEPEPLIVYGDRNLPPYEFQRGWTPQGASVDLNHALAERMGRPVEIRLRQWDDAQNAVLSGAGDALASMVRTPEREARYDFTEETFRMTFSLFVLAERQNDIRSTQLDGLRVGVVDTGFAQAFLSKNHPEARLVVVNDYADGIQRVLRRELDALAADTWSGKYFLAELNIAGIGIVAPPLTEHSAAIAVPKGNPGLVTALDTALSELKRDGTFDRIMDEWSDRKVYLLTHGEVRRAVWSAGAAGIALLLCAGFAWVIRRQRAALAEEVAGRQRTESALAESEALFKSFTDAQPGLVFVADKDGRNTFVNGALQAYTGLPEEELLGDGWLQVVHRHDAGRVARIWAEAVACGADYEAEFRIHRHDGSFRWFLCRGRPVREKGTGRILRWVGVASDIEDLKRIEQALQAERDRARGYLRVASVILLVLDNKGRIETINRRGAEILGYPEEAQLIGRDWFALALPPTAMPRTRREFERLIAGELETPAVCDQPLLCRNGTQRLIAWRHTVLRDDSGRIVGSLSSGEDVTEARRAEALLARDKAELERLVEERTTQLVQSQKMEAVGLLTGGIAHDFNNVLQAVSSCLSVLERHVAEGEPRRMVDAAQRSIESGARLTQSLLAFARRQALAPESVGMRQLLDSIRPLLERALGGMIAIRIDVAADTPPALVDRAQLESAILNLAINARDAMPTGGTLSLRAAPVLVQEGEHGYPQELRPGEYVKLTVRDTGTGMDAETLSRVFEPFFTTKAFGKGSGLGLSMVHGMAVQSGGGVSVRSRPGRGTIVTLYLPRTAPAASPSPAPVESSQSGGSGRVLLVDDNALVRDALQIVLEGMGYRVLAAGGGEAALRLLREGARVDVLVTDYAMPGMNGSVLAREAQRLVPGLPVLLTTGYAEKLDDMQGIALLHKPFKAEDIAERLSALLHGNTPASSALHDG